MEKTNEKIRVSMADSIILMVIIVALIVVCVRAGLNMAVPLFLTWLIMYLYSKIRKLDWKTVQGYGLEGVMAGFGAVLITASVGLLVGAWILGGTIPTLIYYGLQLIQPSIFLPATLLLCCLLSTLTGTSYGSAASAGLACMGIGISMGFKPGVIAGAIICGALFGDKMSPMSDTTNLAPAMSGGELFPHIKSMFYTTVPGILITTVIFAVLGMGHSAVDYDPVTVREYMAGLAENFNLGLIPVLPCVLVIVLLLCKVPAMPSILLGACFGGISAMLTQGASFTQVIQVMHKGFSIDSGILLVDKLLNRGGLSSMYDILMIMIFAMGLGNMLDRLGILSNLMSVVIKKINSVFSLVACTMVVSYLSSAIGCTQSMAHVLTGKLMAPIYREKGVSPYVQSRTMEDSGTLGGVLIPWHTNSVYMVGTLGVAYIEYLPYVFLCFIVPVIALILAATGYAIWYVDPETGESIPKEQAPINQKK